MNLYFATIFSVIVALCVLAAWYLEAVQKPRQEVVKRFNNLAPRFALANQSEIAAMVMALEDYRKALKDNIEAIEKGYKMRASLIPRQFFVQPGFMFGLEQKAGGAIPLQGGRREYEELLKILAVKGSGFSEEELDTLARALCLSHTELIDKLKEKLFKKVRDVIVPHSAGSPGQARRYAEMFPIYLRKDILGYLFEGRPLGEPQVRAERQENQA